MNTVDVEHKRFLSLEISSSTRGPYHHLKRALKSLESSMEKGENPNLGANELRGLVKSPRKLILKSEKMTSMASEYIILGLQQTEKGDEVSAFHHFTRAVSKVPFRKLIDGKKDAIEDSFNSHFGRYSV